jgi:hypothetical protein
MPITVPTNDCVAGHHEPVRALQIRHLRLASGADVALPMCNAHAQHYDWVLAQERRLGARAQR